MLKKINAVGGVLVLIVILFLIFRGSIQQNELDRSGIMTVGTTQGQNVVSGGVWIKYSFFVDSIEYHGASRAFEFKPEIVGGKYFLKYLPKDPNVNEIYWDKPISQY